MKIEIITIPLHLSIHGYGAAAADKNYAATAFALSGKMWEVVKTNGIKNKGQNIWVYENNHHVFAGVELNDQSQNKNATLEEKKITLPKYAYYKHIGPYSLIKQAGENMTNELKKQGFVVALPYIEIYGHWNADENKCETELFMTLQ